MHRLPPLFRCHGSACCATVNTIMSLKKKIALSFFISAFIIAILAAFEYFSFIEIRKEIRYLEITDTISRKSLQLRRHEKNYLLYSPQQADEESRSVHSYINELKELLQNPNRENADTRAFRDSILAYEKNFDRIESLSRQITQAFERAKSARREHARHFAFIEATFLEQPLKSAAYLEEVFHLSRDHELVRGLIELVDDIAALRKNGESIVVISKDLDKVAREKVETVIGVSQMAILVFFPLFFAVGIGTLFFISTNVVKRLMLLIKVVEKTGKGSFPHLSVPPMRGGAQDEVGLLIDKFNNMEDELAERETELDRKNKELSQTRKLAAIGTLAAGVAHELNNPLNNIHLSAQVLSREAKSHASPVLHEAVADILGQTARVKRIVGDLLEFARGREPRMRKVDMVELISGVFKKLAVDTSNVRFTINSKAGDTVFSADPEQMEQVFINLFTNAVEARQEGLVLTVAIRSAEDALTIVVSDSGRGMPKESLDKIFEPFFTTKDKGTGLGLAIVFNIIRKHYGEIRAASEEGKGTTFTITLPRMDEPGA